MIQEFRKMRRSEIKKTPKICGKSCSCQVNELFPQCESVIEKSGLVRRKGIS